jgi:NAD+ synthase (glutamine-hydrolysing)
MRQTSFGEAVRQVRGSIDEFRTIGVSTPIPRHARIHARRSYDRFPYVPADPARRNERCTEVFHIQVQGLAKRLEHTGLEHVVIGVSGGADSTHALLVCAQAMDKLGYPRSNVLAYSMPGFGTSPRTLQQAHELMQAVGATAREIDIRPSCMQMFRDIGHPFADGTPVYDTTFENVQAGERTSHLFRLANLHAGLVVGTGDLSELALGWCTYGVGDHMSHYSVNASVPKTLIRHLIRWAADTDQLGRPASETLRHILSTQTSPELIPGVDESGQPAQESEAAIGPYGLQDFHLYYTLRFGYAPPKVAFLAHSAWHARNEGIRPDLDVLEGEQNEYDLAEIKAHLRTFIERFFRISQFKRSCVPNAPKVGSGGSLSPRGDYRAPSDSEATAWLAQLDMIPD